MPKANTEIRSLARKHTAKAINVLAGIMNSPKALDSARVSAATALLDRGWGKAPQKIEGELSINPIAQVLGAIDGKTKDLLDDDTVH